MPVPLGIKIIAITYRFLLGFLLVYGVYVLFTDLDEGFGGLLVPVVFFYLAIFWYGFYVLTSRLMEGDNKGRYGLIIYSLVGAYGSAINLGDGPIFGEKNYWPVLFVLLLLFFTWTIIYLLFTPRSWNFFSPKKISFVEFNQLITKKRPSDKL